MGMNAHGVGEAVLDRDADLNECRRLASELNNTYKDITIELIEEIEYNRFYITDSSSHWDENDILEVLEKIKPHLITGKLTYNDYDGNNWRYEFYGNEWKEVTADIIYNLNDYNDAVLIEELKKRGYTVTKK